MSEELNLDILKKLGAMTHELRKEVSKMPKVGMDITVLIDFIEKKIFDAGYLPAFPCTVSVNEIAAHYTVFDEDEHILAKGDLIKIDFGISEDGFITDNAVTVEIESNEHAEMMAVNLEGLNAVMELIKPGVKMEELGECVDRIARANGFRTIENLCGHQIARNNLHCGLSVPNLKNGDKRLVEVGQEFAVEPFFTKGDPRVKSCGGSNILHLQNTKPVRDAIAKKVLDFIKVEYPHLPFSKRWLLKDVRKELGLEGGFDKRRVLYALKVLKKYGQLYEYDALASVDGSFVSQYEDVVVFSKSGEKTIITRL
jgi:methionyl aminopeptidase